MKLRIWTPTHILRVVDVQGGEVVRDDRIPVMLEERWGRGAAWSAKAWSEGAAADFAYDAADPADTVPDPGPGHWRTSDGAGAVVAADPVAPYVAGLRGADGTAHVVLVGRATGIEQLEAAAVWPDTQDGLHQLEGYATGRVDWAPFDAAVVEALRQRAGDSWLLRLDRVPALREGVVPEVVPIPTPRRWSQTIAEVAREEPDGPVEVAGWIAGLAVWRSAFDELLANATEAPASRLAGIDHGDDGTPTVHAGDRHASDASVGLREPQLGRDSRGDVLPAPAAPDEDEASAGRRSPLEVHPAWWTWEQDVIGELRALPQGTELRWNDVGIDPRLGVAAGYVEVDVQRLGRFGGLIWSVNVPADDGSTLPLEIALAHDAELCMYTDGPSGDAHALVRRTSADAPGDADGAVTVTPAWRVEAISGAIEAWIERRTGRGDVVVRWDPEVMLWGEEAARSAELASAIADLRSERLALEMTRGGPYGRTEQQRRDVEQLGPLVDLAGAVATATASLRVARGGPAAPESIGEPDLRVPRREPDGSTAVQPEPPDLGERSPHRQTKRAGDVAEARHRAESRDQGVRRDLDAGWW